MMSKPPSILVALALLAGCATQPKGPSVAVMPAPNKPFEVFREDDVICRDFASRQLSGGAESFNQQALGAAALGTLLGAGLGAAVGDGKGAAVGAAGGALAGTAVGGSRSDQSGQGLQARYDIAYQQCMYSKGNQVPGYALPPGAVPPPPPPPQRRP